VTPIQLVMAYATVANGGFLMRPFSVRRVVGQNGAALFENEPHVVRRAISERTARSVTSILKGVVSDGGTGVMANVEGFEVAGKTGTSQKPDPVHGGYASGKRVASFVGFVPADDPRLVLLVLIDEPEVNVYGGVVAAPAFRNVTRAALRHLGVVPDRLEPAPIPVTADEKLPSRDTATGSESARRENDLEVPDFLGLSLRQAIAKARALRLQVELRGHGYVVKQSPDPGEPSEKGTKVILNLQG
jgi:cell division protein FtsI (penicillin-binding protein 3)